MIRLTWVLVASAAVLSAGCLDGGQIELSSPAFEDAGGIPVRFTCEGDNVSPPLAIGAGVPDDARALVLVVDDPDAPSGTFTHWTIWNLPPDTAEIPEDIPRTERVPPLGDAAQGTNDADRIGYTGPCPPEGDDAHTYRFTLHSLAEPLDLDPGAPRSTVDDAIADVALTRGNLRGTFAR